MADAGKAARVKVELVNDWRSAKKWSSVRLAAALTLLYGLLAMVAPWIGPLSDHWPEIAPFVLKFFPTASQAVGPFIGGVLSVLARVVVVRFPHREGDQ
ncbi:hypothetical protein OVY01_00130 [Robbsia sp. Bb-Pol-6]|uniref:Holin of 3TMs, for gene-transfer release n=1 Tax=Robbsia betulipollinis TaxID=2981849 RepID=A0ABT3ZGX2_9BURK|nr:hypothetical protein [Robbsia betulipollinis]MCY0385672.1 hypothetical protein [Robbsia betulipollinis]